MRILFWGTPDFAVPTLAALLGEEHDVVGVVTQPDRPAGRGREVRPPAVKQAAAAEGIPVLQPERPRGDDFMAAIRALEPDLSVVVAYGQILRREVLDVPARGSINVHASLLPRLRGAAPINWSIIEGHDVTGVTIMRMVERLDAGPILLQVREPIGPDETADELRGRLSELGAEALIEALVLLDLGELPETEQDEAAATFAPRLTRELARVDWSRDAVVVSRWLRGLDETPGAWTTLAGAELKVFSPRPAPEHEHGEPPGRVLRASPNPEEGMLVACGAGAVWVRSVKPAGKRRMTAAEWARGRTGLEGALLA